MKIITTEIKNLYFATLYKGGPGRLGKVLLVRIVKNVVVVYSSVNSLTPSRSRPIGRF